VVVDHLLYSEARVAPYFRLSGRCKSWRNVALIQLQQHLWSKESTSAVCQVNIMRARAVVLIAMTVRPAVQVREIT
jgi:hypothetical protein